MGLRTSNRLHARLSRLKQEDSFTMEYEIGLLDISTHAVYNHTAVSQLARLSMVWLVRK